jgi:hypothetical protein
MEVIKPVFPQIRTEDSLLGLMKMKKKNKKAISEWGKKSDEIYRII